MILILSLLYFFAGWALTRPLVCTAELVRYLPTMFFTRAGWKKFRKRFAKAVRKASQHAWKNKMIRKYLVTSALTATGVGAPIAGVAGEASTHVD